MRSDLFFFQLESQAALRGVEVDAPYDPLYSSLRAFSGSEIRTALFAVGDDDPGVPSKNLQSNTVLPDKTVRAAEDVSPYDPFEQACTLSSKAKHRLSCSHVGDDDPGVPLQNISAEREGDTLPYGLGLLRPIPPHPPQAVPLLLKGKTFGCVYCFTRQRHA